jgi:hypothetical protein
MQLLNIRHETIYSQTLQSILPLGKVYQLPKVGLSQSRSGYCDEKTKPVIMNITEIVRTLQVVQFTRFGVLGQSLVIRRGK